MIKIINLFIAIMAIISVFYSWHFFNGFLWNDKAWWIWIFENIKQNHILPAAMMQILYIGIGTGLFLMLLSLTILNRMSSTIIFGDRKAEDLHGSARWAKYIDVKKTGLLVKTGVIVGGFKKLFFGTKTLNHNGPEHILAFAPTRSGKGVGLVIPTLLNWQGSMICLDIKGENYHLTAGYRASLGQHIIKFDPTSLDGSNKYNPLAEIRIGTEHEIEDCQNISSMVIDSEGKGLKDYWMQAGWEWLTTCILHVLYYEKINNDGRIATLKDVHHFMSVGHGDDDIELNPDESFNQLCDDMAEFKHGRDIIDQEVMRSAGAMKKKASQERSGVHSSAKIQLSLYSDPIVSKNISSSDFTINDLMNRDAPVSLYIIIPPSDMDRLKPLIRILMNQFLTRLTASMKFENGKAVKSYEHRMLLMLDEFTSIGKLEIFERSLAFMAGYGLKAFIIIQDITQLNKAYGKDNSIMANCHIRIAFAPNTIETAKTLSDMVGKTTIIQRKKSRSGKAGAITGNTSENINEIARPLLTPDECMRIKSITTNIFGKAVAGNMLIFVAGHQPIFGRQILFFNDKEMLEKSQIPIPKTSKPLGEKQED